MSFYKRCISVTNMLWAYSWKLFIPILILLVLVEGYFLHNNFTKAVFENFYDYSYSYDYDIKPGVWSLRFEEYLARSHVKEIFLLALLITVFLLISISIRQKLVTQAEYTYLRLPISPYAWFWSSAIFSSAILFILISVQFLIVFGGYQMYLHFVEEGARMSQSLFLAFVRWDFLKYLFPITDPLRLVLNTVYLIFSGVLISYINMNVLLKGRGLFTIIISLFLYIGFFERQSIGGTIFIIVALLLLTIWMVFNYRSMLEELGGEKQDVR